MKTFLVADAHHAGAQRVVTSCSDDDDELNEEQKERQAQEQADLTGKYWAVVGQLAGSDSWENIRLDGKQQPFPHWSETVLPY